MQIDCGLFQVVFLSENTNLRRFERQFNKNKSMALENAETENFYAMEPGQFSWVWNLVISIIIDNLSLSSLGTNLHERFDPSVDDKFYNEFNSHMIAMLHSYRLMYKIVNSPRDVSQHSICSLNFSWWAEHVFALRVIQSESQKRDQNKIQLKIT